MGTKHVAYDYLSAEVPPEYEHMYNDCYESLGWEYMESLHIHTGQPNSQSSTEVHLQYRRPHALPNRSELVELQKECETQLKSIRSLEQWVGTVGMIVALAIGVIGAVLVLLGSILFLNAHHVWAVMLCVIGLAGCAAAFPLFLRVTKRKASDTQPDVEIRREKLQQMRLRAVELLDEKG